MVVGPIATPRVSAVVPTRNRGRGVAATVHRLLADDNGELEVIVVDQSDDGATRATVGALAQPGLRYVRTATRGSAAARNVGIAHAKGEIIGLIDDDCDAPGSWVRELVAAFARDERIGVVFGNVLAAPHDPATGFVPAYVRKAPSLARGIGDHHRSDGVAACMGLRRAVWSELGGFDEMLGVGARLKSAAEGDLALRALRAGHYVYETPQWTVVHRGFFTWAQRPAVIHRYWYGTGAMIAKHLKCDKWALGPLLLRLAWRWAFGRSGVAASLGTGAHRWLRLIAFVQGLVAGMLTPVDRSAGHYRRPRSRPQERLPRAA